MERKYTIPFIALTSLFFLWGFMTVIVDAFVPRLKEVFELLQWQANMVQFAWFMAYGLISIPAGWIISRIDYKGGIILGLAICGIGCLTFIPAAEYRVFVFFLMALFTLAAGITVLQVAANPFVSVLGPERTASSRLNLAQTFNSLGTFVAPVFAVSFLLSDKILNSDEIAALDGTARAAYYTQEASAVQGPFWYIGGAFLLLSLLFFAVKLPNILPQKNSEEGYLAFVKYPRLWLGMIGIFVYVGAEVAIGTNLINYFLSQGMAELIPDNGAMMGIASFVSEIFQGQPLSNMDAKGVVGVFVIFYWGGAMIGRLIGSYLTTIFNPGRTLSVFALCAVVLILLTIGTGGFWSMWTVLSIGLFNSIMFPTIFTKAIDGLDSFKPKASGLLCTAIVGGAFIPPIFGLFVDVFSWQSAFIVPIICYLFIYWYGRKYPVSNPGQDV